ncbi:MAG TPA: ABC transporter substrate-binding protein [Candidatus Binatia bacterium]|nr:ABC transporter substrate-binding protein [Candidatus Binatia bacterium]
MKRPAFLALSATLVSSPALISAQSLTSIDVAAVPADASTPVLWAQQSGIFRRHGIEVRLSPERSGSAVAAGVAGGSYTIGNSSLVSLITAHVRGLPFVLVAPGGLYRARNPTVALLVKRDSPIRNAADLNGKTVAVSSLNDLFSLSTKLWVDKNGGDSMSLKVLEFPVSAVGDALASGRVDAGGVGSPELEEAIDSGKARLLAYMYDAIAPEFLYTGWFTTADYASRNPSVVHGFAEAMRESASYTNGHPSATVASMSKFTGIDAAKIAKMHRVANGTVLDPRLIQPLIDYAAKYKMIPTAFDARDLIAKGFDGSS